MAKENKWNDVKIRGEAAKFFTNTQSEITTRRELPWAK